MLALLHHPSLVYHYNIIGTYHRAQAMSDDDYSLFFHQVVDSILDVNLVFGIERSGCLVKQHDWRIFQNGTGIVDGGDTWYEFDMVPGEHEIRTCGPDVTGKVCVIGSQLKEHEVEELFHA